MNEKTIEMVDNSLNELPTRYLLPIYLKYIEGFEIDEISTVMSENINSIHQIINKGLERLMHILKKKGIILSLNAMIQLIGEVPLTPTPINIKTFINKIIYNNTITPLSLV